MPKVQPRIVDERGTMITFSEASRRTNCNHSTIHYWFKTGQINTLKDIVYRMSEEGSKIARERQFKGRPPTIKENDSFDRNKACFRRNKDNIINEKCTGYWDLTETFFNDTQELPPRCKEARGRSCPNYKGKELESSKIDFSMIENDEELMPKYSIRVGGE